MRKLKQAATNSDWEHWIAINGVQKIKEVWGMWIAELITIALTEVAHNNSAGSKSLTSLYSASFPPSKLPALSLYQKSIDAALSIRNWCSLQPIFPKPPLSSIPPSHYTPPHNIRSLPNIRRSESQKKKKTSTRDGGRKPNTKIKPKIATTEPIKPLKKKNSSSNNFDLLYSSQYCKQRIVESVFKYVW